MGDVNPVRIPLIETITSRDASTRYDTKLVNCIADTTRMGEKRAVKRYGLTPAFQGPPGVGQGITNYLDNLYSISGDTFATFSSSTTLSIVAVTNSAGFSKRTGAMAAGFLGALYVMGGVDSGGNALNDVWTSPDGVAWTQVTAAAPWGPRAKGAAIVLNNALYVMGGATSVNGTYYNDVWKTLNGVTWTQVTPAAPWAGRRRFGFTVFNNQMWIAGGAGATASNPIYPNTFYDDVWASTDGHNWINTTQHAPWVGRSDLAFYTANNTLHITGGLLNDAFTKATGDNWSSPDGATWTRVSSNPFGVNSSRIWPVAAFDPAGMDFPLPSTVTVGSGGGGTGATAWAFTDFDDDGDDDDLQAGQYAQLTFSNVGVGYISVPPLTLGTNVGFPAQAYGFLDGSLNQGAKEFQVAALGNTVYLLEWNSTGAFSHVLWATQDGITFTNLGLPASGIWQPRDGTFFAQGGLWFTAGIDGSNNYYNDVWSLAITSGNIALNADVPLGFYHFTQTSVGITTPLLVLKSTGDLFSWSGSTLTKLSNVANYPPVTVPGIVYLDGYFFVMDPKGTIWNSGINDPSTWTALGTIAMENEPNGGVAIAKLANYVVGFGKWTIEFFYDGPAPNSPPASPLLPNTSMPVQVGCAAGESVVECQGSVVWIGQTRREGQSVYIMDQYNPHRISDAFIDRIIQSDPLTDISAYTQDIFGHSCYILTLNITNITLVYDFIVGMWYTWTSTSQNASQAVQSITTDPYGTATVVAVNHGYLDGSPVLISGAAIAGYNRIFNISVVDSNTFTIQVGSQLPDNPGTAVARNYTESAYQPVASAQILDQDYVQDPANGVVYLTSGTQFNDNGSPIAVQIVTSRWDGGTTEWKYLRRISLASDSELSSAVLSYTDNDYQSFSRARIMNLQQGQRPTLPQGGRFRRRAFKLIHTASTPFRAEALELEVIKGAF